MQIKKYKKKPVVIEAMRLAHTGQSMNAACDWIGSSVSRVEWNSRLVTSCSVHIKTLEGVMKARVGDYIIKGIAGEFYPCKADIFEASYEGADGEGQ